MEIEVAFANGSRKLLHQRVIIRAKTTGVCESEIMPIEAGIAYQGYDESTATKGIGEYQIFYRTNEPCDQELKKPIIIVDAWDPKDDRDIDELYKEKLVYFVGSTKHNLAAELRTKGYDIVILNFPADKFVEHSFHFPLFHHAINIYRDGGTD